MIRKLPWLVSLMALGLGGCGDNIRERLGLASPSPDEYRVTSHAPLAVPPEFDLKPPVPGAPALTVIQTEDTAEAILTGRDPNASVISSDLPAQSEAELRLLEKAGADRADPAIRETLAREAAAAPEKKEKQGWLSRLTGRRDDDGKDKDKEEEPLQAIKPKPKIDGVSAPDAAAPAPAGGTPPAPATLPEPAAP